MPSQAATFEIRWRLTDIGGIPGAWSNKTVPANVSSIRLEGLERGKSYEGEARALSAAGGVSDWVPLTFTVDDPSLMPRTPTSLTALPVADAVSLKWSVDADQPADVDYSIEAAPAAIGPFTEFTRTRAKQYSIPFVDSTVRWFRVRAVNFGVVYSPYSNTVSAGALSTAEIEAAVIAAQAAADAANADLANIASDAMLTPDEKPRVILDRDVIVNEQAGIDAKAVALGITTQKTAYDNAVTALVNYLATLTTPTLWSNLSGNTTIVGVTFRTKFADVYAARQLLLNRIYVETLDQLPDGNDYARVKKVQVQNGYLPPYSFGDELVVNGSFESVQAGGTAVQTTAVGTVMGDGWSLEQTNGTMPPACSVEFNNVYRTGLRAQRINFAAGAYPPNVSNYSIVQMKNTIPTVGGETFVVRVAIGEYYSTAFPAGITGRIAFAGLRFFDANNVFISDGGVRFSGLTRDIGTDMQIRKEGTVTAPLNAAYAAIIMFNFVSVNASGATVAGVISDLRFDDLSIKRITTKEMGANMLSDSEYTKGPGGGASPWVNTRSTTKTETIGSMWVFPTVNAANTADYHYQEVLYVIAGQKYSLSANYSWTASSALAVLGLVVNWYNAGNTLIGQSFSRTVDPDGPSTVKGGTPAATAGQRGRLTWNGLVAPATAVKAIFHVEFVGPYTNLAISKCKFEQGLIATDYVASSEIAHGQELTVRGSRRLLGGARNMPVSQTMGAGSVRNTTALSANSSGQVSVAAHSNNLNGETVSYNAVSNAVVGLTVNVTYVIYCFDVFGDGGTRTWFAATSVLNAQAAGDGVVIAGNITIPTSGSSSGGGGGAGDPDDWCPEVDMLLPDGRRVGDLKVGDEVPCWNMDVDNPAIEMHPVRAIVFADADCAELEFDNGAVVRQSLTTPMHLRTGEVRRTLETYGTQIINFIKNAMAWGTVERIDLRGRRRVAKIDCGDRVFFCGLKASATVGTHNIRYKP